MIETTAIDIVPFDAVDADFAANKDGNITRSGFDLASATGFRQSFTTFLASTGTPLYVGLSQIAAAYYFAHFLIILPLVSKRERTLPLPDSISTSVLHGEQQEAAPIGARPRPPSVAG